MNRSEGQLDMLTWQRAAHCKLRVGVARFRCADGVTPVSDRPGRRLDRFAVGTRDVLLWSACQAVHLAGVLGSERIRSEEQLEQCDVEPFGNTGCFVACRGLDNQIKACRGMDNRVAGADRLKLPLAKRSEPISIARQKQT